MNRRDRLERWREALLLPGESNLLSSGLRELCEFYGIGREEALSRAQSAVRASKKVWNSRPRLSPSEVIDFYDTCEEYVFEHVYWHATLTEGETLANVAILEYAQEQGIRSYLDLGGGVGANLILFAQAGLQVATADVSGPMLAFARWRMERRGLPATFIDLKTDPLPEGSFELMTTIDVLEHVPDPLSTLAGARSALTPGGQVVVGMAFGYDPERPMHLVHTPRRFLSGVRALGLRRLRPPLLEDFSFLRTYRRVERNRLTNLILLAGDTLVEGARGMGRFATTVSRKAWGGAS